MLFPNRSDKTELYSFRRQQEAGNFGFRKQKNSIITVVKTRALISFPSASLFSHLQFVGFLMTWLKSLYNELHLFLTEQTTADHDCLFDLHTD